MSIFGKLDAAAVKSNPLFVEAGTYHAEVTNAYFKEFNKKDGSTQRQLHITYTINEPESQYDNKIAKKFYNLVDPELTPEAFALLPADDRAQIEKDMTTLKKDLCGNTTNSFQKGLGVPADDLNDDNWDPKSLVGTKVVIGVRNGGADNESVYVQWVNLDDKSE